MKNSFTVNPIAYIQTDFKEKFGIPRQSGRAPSLTAKIVFTPEYRNAESLREIEGFSHLWLLFDFSLAHKTEWSATVRPPRLGGKLLCKKLVNMQYFIHLYNICKKYSKNLKNKEKKGCKSV